MTRAAESGPPLSDRLAGFVAGRYAAASREAGLSGQEGWERLRELWDDLIELRRGDHRAVWLQMERERLELRKRKRSGNKPPDDPIKVNQG